MGEFTDGVKFIREQATLTIIVIKGGSKPEPPKPKPDPGTDYPDWPDEPKPDLIPDNVDPTDDPDLDINQKPVPRIASLSDTGLLKIRWDQTMLPPADFN